MPTESTAVKAATKKLLRASSKKEIGLLVGCSRTLA
jgi:hypothetical protein